LPYPGESARIVAVGYEVIVIGAGIGGLSCAAKLAHNGKRVLVLEKDRHVGGTSFIFQRDGYSFPMGPLSFSFPEVVRGFLSGLGLGSGLEFKKNNFQLIAPLLDIVYSVPFAEVIETLKAIFISERKALETFSAAFETMMTLAGNVHLWHPGYRIGIIAQNDQGKSRDFPGRFERIETMSRTPCREMLNRYFSDRRLINFLGSQGTSSPEASLLNLAFMWNVMSREGIWSPSIGIHGLSELLAASISKDGGEIALGTAAAEILIRNGRAVGVKDVFGKSHLSGWVVANADYKKTFLELIRRKDVPQDAAEILNLIRRVPYTGSELCVYLGIDPRKMDSTRMKATHLFYRHKEADQGEGPQDLEDFENREIEICAWSDNAPGLSPPGKASLVLRVGFPYDHFLRFRTGEKKRNEAYKPHKSRLAQRLVRTAENVLPGLGAAIEVTEAATPLTYEDWGHRFQGSIAGWTWSAGYEGAFKKRLLVETPIRNLLMAGIYAASELFLGGVPTAVATGDLAASVVLG
jgi:all-trans-retinol 13,14-reductase